MSEDITQGSMTRRSDGVSTFDFSLMNARRKYDLKFTPNDRIVVMMKRITWVQVFTGLLNSVPLRTAWPREVPLSASCSLKRLQYFYWDPYASASIAMMRRAFDDGQKQGAGVTGSMIVALLSNVVRWPKKSIHLGEIPADWFQLAVEVAKEVKQWSDDAVSQVEDYYDSIGVSAIIGGSVTDRIRTALGLDGQSNGNSFGTSFSNPPGVSPITGDVSGGFHGTWAPQDASEDGNHVFITASEAGVATALPAAGTAQGILKPGIYGGQDLTQAQLDVAARIYEIMACNWSSRSTNGSAAIRRLPNQVLWAAMCAARAESGFDPNAQNPTSPAHGVFQLLSHGTKAQESSVDYSTNWWVNQFLAKYTDAQASASLDPGAVALKIEVSGQPSSFYGQYTAMGRAIVTEINKAIIRGRKLRSGTSGTGVVTGSRTATGGDMVTTLLRLITDYPRIPYPSPTAGPARPVDMHTPPQNLDCSALVAWGVYHTLGGLHGCPTVSSAQAAWCSKRLSAKDALNIPGALVFLSTNGQPSGTHHVEVSVGNGTDTVGAHYPGSPAGVEGLGASYWAFGGLMPVFSYPGEHAPGIPSSSGNIHSGGTKIWPTHDHTVDVAFRKKNRKGAADDDWYSNFHTGVDFAGVRYGDDVHTVDGGKVQVVNGVDTAQFGNYVGIRSGNVLHLYAHLSAIEGGITEGTKVSAGDKIGEVGNTGQVLPRPRDPSDHKTGVHLHFEVRKPPFAGGASDAYGDPVTFITKGLTVATQSTTTNADGSTSTTGQPPTTYSKSDGFDPSSPVDALFAEQDWYSGDTDSGAVSLSNQLTGAYTLANDTTVLQYLMQLCGSSMRSFSSAPNGDFIAWFPDYYGLWGTAAVLQIEDIELQDFNITWSDDNFVTHQFVQMAISTGLDPGTGLVNTNWTDLFQQATGAGVANIDSPAVMAALFGFPPENAEKFASYIYKKFGARPNIKRIDAMMKNKASEFFMALFYFMLQWAYQYQASIPITFMPEAWPGMLVQVRSFNFQAYITSVTHTFSFGEGGSFGTQINIAAPALLEGGGKQKGDNALIGLPLAGGYGNTHGLLTAANQGASGPPSVSPPVDQPTTGGSQI